MKMLTTVTSLKIKVEPSEEEQLFNSFLSILQREVDLRGLDYKSAKDDPDFDEFSINLSFGFEKEAEVDNLIRYIRDHLSWDFYIRKNLCDEVKLENIYPVAVRKSYIHSSCWSVFFYFSYKHGWQFHEDTQ